MVAVGLVIPPQLIATEPDGVVALAAFTIRKLPAVAVFTVQPDAAPRPLGCETRVEEEFTNPLGVVHVPEAVVQAVKLTDLIAVPVVGTAAVTKSYCTLVAPPAELERVTLRPVIWAAWALPAKANGIIMVAMAKTAATKARVRANILSLLLWYNILSPVF